MSGKFSEKVCVQELWIIFQKKLHYPVINVKKKTDDLYHKEERVGDPALKLL